MLRPLMASGDSENKRTLTISFKIPGQGIPVSTNTYLFVKTIRIDSGVVASLHWFTIKSGMKAFQENIEAPATQLLIVAGSIGTSGNSFVAGSSLQGSRGIGPRDKAVEIQLDPLRTGSSSAGSIPTVARYASQPGSPSASRYKLYPPKSGKAIGYNPVDFHVSGGDIEHLAEGFAFMLTTDLAGTSCSQTNGSNGGNDSFVVVETANPKILSLIESELDLQKSPEFDQSTVVTPHLIGPTHLAKGDITIVNGQVTVKYRIEDLSGKVIASASSTGSVSDIMEQLNTTGRDLGEKLCKPTNPWTGTIIYKLDDTHGSTTESKSASTVKTTTTTSNKRTIIIRLGATGRPRASVSITDSLKGDEVGERNLGKCKIGWDKITEGTSTANKDFDVTTGVGAKNGRYTISVILPAIEGRQLISIKTHEWSECNGSSGDTTQGPFEIPWKFEYYFPDMEGALLTPDTISGSVEDKARGGKVTWNLTRTSVGK